MNGSMEANTLPKKMLVLLIRIGMPILSIILLLGISPTLERNVVGSEEADFAERVLISIIFCLSYAGMPFISKGFWYWTFPEFKRTNIIVFPKSLALSMTIVLTRFIFYGILTKITIDRYLPIFNRVSIILAIMNGIIFAWPAYAQYVQVSKKAISDS